MASRQSTSCNSAGSAVRPPSDSWACSSRVRSVGRRAWLRPQVRSGTWPAPLRRDAPAPPIVGGLRPAERRSRPIGKQLRSMSSWVSGLPAWGDDGRGGADGRDVAAARWPHYPLPIGRPAAVDSVSNARLRSRARAICVSGRVFRLGSFSCRGTQFLPVPDLPRAINPRERDWTKHPRSR